ncbi:isocitrate lyase/phosphoenolpyruvate mutase family protein [Nocardia sp. NPDC056541]|uniref:isocitrate lyase/phosphoenolpyruvate mutase family protein n=1 Tax=Nocardia sp. NPDC056541 TaxID=3345860 RepID=UPI003673243E
MDSEQRTRAQAFVDLHREGCFLLPNAWDAGSARILESVGFPAIATTSAGVAFSSVAPTTTSSPSTVRTVASIVRR